MALFLEHNPSAAFLSLLGATVIWGSGGVVYGLPASFLSVSLCALPPADKYSLWIIFVTAHSMSCAFNAVPDLQQVFVRPGLHRMEQ